MTKTVNDEEKHNFASFFFKTDSPTEQPVMVQDAIEIEIRNGNPNDLTVANVTL